MKNPPKLIPGADIKLPHMVGDTALRKNKQYPLQQQKENSLICYNALVMRTNKNGVYVRVGNRI